MQYGAEKKLRSSQWMIEDSASGQILEVGTAWERSRLELTILWT